MTKNKILSNPSQGVRKKMGNMKKDNPIFPKSESLFHSPRPYRGEKLRIFRHAAD
jgi:hypothetical protein